MCFPPPIGGNTPTQPEFSETEIDTTGDEESTDWGKYRGNYCRCEKPVHRYTDDGYPFCKECGPPTPSEKPLVDVADKPDPA